MTFNNIQLAARLRIVERATACTEIEQDRWFKESSEINIIILEKKRVN